jgi:hypothetical protein
MYKVFSYFIEKKWVVLALTYSYFLVAIVTSSSWVYAQSILTEGIVIPLKIFAMSILLKGLVEQKLSLPSLVVYSICLVFILPLLSIIRAHEYIFVILSVIIWMFVIIKSRSSYKIIFPAAFLLVALFFMVSCQLFQKHLYISSGGLEVDIFGVKSLYCNNLKIVNRSEADIEIKKRADYLISQGPQGWKRNEFNGDACYYDAVLNSLINNKFPSVFEKYQYYKSMTLISLENDLFLWARRFVKQVLLVHSSPVFISNDSVTGSFPNIEEYRKVAAQYSLTIDFGQRYEKSVTIGSRTVLKLVAILYAFVQLAIIVFFIFSIHEKNKSLFIFWFWFNALLLSNLAVVGLAHTYDVSRYQHSNVPLYLMATFVFLAVFIRAISSSIKARAAR